MMRPAAALLGVLFAGATVARQLPAEPALLWRLIGEYVGNFAPAIADEWLGRIREDSLDRLHSAWRSTRRGARITL